MIDSAGLLNSEGVLVGCWWGGGVLGCTRANLPSPSCVTSHELERGIHAKFSLITDTCVCVLHGWWGRGEIGGVGGVGGTVGAFFSEKGRDSIKECVASFATP